MFKKNKEKREYMSYQELMEKYQEQLQKYQEQSIKYKEQSQKCQDLQIENENLKLENQNLKKVIFGVRREYTSKQDEIVDGTQTSLFEDVQTEEEIDEQIKENVEEITVHQKKKTRKRKAGIKRSSAKEIIIEREIIDIDEENKLCSECQNELELIGKRVVDQDIEYIPAKIVIKEYIQYTYKCSHCSTDEKAVIIRGKMPRPLLPHSFVSPSLAAEVFYQKYYLGTPLYRQEKMWDDIRTCTSTKYDGKLGNKNKSILLRAIMEIDEEAIERHV